MAVMAPHWANMPEMAPGPPGPGPGPPGPELPALEATAQEEAEAEAPQEEPTAKPTKKAQLGKRLRAFASILLHRSHMCVYKYLCVHIYI